MRNPSSVVRTIKSVVLLCVLASCDSRQLEVSESVPPDVVRIDHTVQILSDSFRDSRTPEPVDGYIPGSVTADVVVRPSVPGPGYRFSMKWNSTAAPRAKADRWLINWEIYGYEIVEEEGVTRRKEIIHETKRDWEKSFNSSVLLLKGFYEFRLLAQITAWTEEETFLANGNVLFKKIEIDLRSVK